MKPEPRDPEDATAYAAPRVKEFKKVSMEYF